MTRTLGPVGVGYAIGRHCQGPFFGARCADSSRGHRVRMVGNVEHTVDEALDEVKDVLHT